MSDLKYDPDNEYHNFLIHQMKEHEIMYVKEEEMTDTERMIYLNNIKLRNIARYFNDK